MRICVFHVLGLQVTVGETLVGPRRGRIALRIEMALRDLASKVRDHFAITTVARLFPIVLQATEPTVLPRSP